MTDPMTDRYVRFRSGYKYQLATDYRIKTTIKPRADVNTRFIAMDTNGTLTVKRGYAWDGASGPVFDTDDVLRASLVHDALYQLIRQRKLVRRLHKDRADRLFQKLCKQDGVSSALARIYYEVLKRLGGSFVDPKNAKKVRRAPCSKRRTRDDG